MAVYEGARPRTIALAARPRDRRGPDARPPARPRRGPRRTPDRTGWASSSAPSSSRSCSRSSRSPSRSACRRPGSTSAGSSSTRQRLDDAAAGAPLRPEPARPRAGHPQAGHRRRSRPAVRAARPAAPLGDRANRCWAEPIRAAGSSSCSCVFVRRLVRPRRPAGLLAGHRPRRPDRRRPSPRRRVTLDDPEQARRHLRPDAGRSCWPRPSSATGSSRRRPADRRSSARRPSRRWPGSSASTTRPRHDPARQARRGKRQVRHPRATASTAPSPTRSAAAIAAKSASAAVARARARCASTRRRAAGPDSTPGRPAARLRQSRGRRPVRRRAGLPVDARRPAPGRRRRPRRERPADPRRPRRSSEPGAARRGPDADHRRRPPARGSSRSSSRPGSPTRPKTRLGRRHGPVHGRGLRRGDLPVVRRATTTRRSPRATRRASSTRSSRASTSRARCSR